MFSVGDPPVDGPPEIPATHRDQRHHRLVTFDDDAAPLIATISDRGTWLAAFHGL